MATKIVTKNSSTASAVPTASDLVQGELAVNVADKRLFTEDNGGSIVELGTNPSGNVTFQDNGKAIFGAGSDLQIYHDGSNSYIDEAGQGTLYVRADSATTIANPSNTLSARFRPSTSVSLYYNGVEKLATTATGIDVTGTATMDGLTVNSGTANNVATFTSTDAYALIKFEDNDTTTETTLGALDNDMVFRVGAAERMRIDSAGNVGINNSSPYSPLSVTTTGTLPQDKLWYEQVNMLTLNGTRPRAGLSTAATTGGNLYDGDMLFYNMYYAGGADYQWKERMRITSAGNVGIGTSSPNSYAGQTTLNINSAGVARLDLDIGNTMQGYLLAESGYTGLFTPSGSNSLRFGTNNTERMRIDAGGSILIGKTTPSDLHNTWNHIIIGEKGAIISENGAGGIDGITLSDNAYIDADTGSYAYQTTAAASLITQSAGVTTFSNATSGSAGAALTPVERMRINSAGTTILTNADGSANLGRIQFSTQASTYQILGGNNIGYMGYKTGGYHRWFGSDGAEDMRIDSSGNLLVGESSSNPYNNLTTAHVFKGASSTGGAAPFGIYSSTGTANVPVLSLLSRDTSTDTSSRFMQFFANVTSTTNTPMGGIVGNGANNVQFVSLSDVRDKENITTISGSLSKINNLNPVEFDWIASGEHCKAGFVAQEVEEVFPEFVVENVASEGQEERKGLTGGMTGGIVAHLVKAIQEQQTLIESLTDRIAALEE